MGVNGGWEIKYQRVNFLRENGIRGGREALLKICTLYPGWA